jgi:hypothetical protein
MISQLAMALAVLTSALGCGFRASQLTHQTPPVPRRAALWNCIALGIGAFGVIVGGDALGWAWVREQPLSYFLVVAVGSVMLAWPWVTGTPADAGHLPAGAGIGGTGGSATVIGKGFAIGGPGGRAGTHGRGGDGGGGVVEGEGLAAGGEGGHAAEDEVWKPPARSGYEVMMRQLGQPVDPALAQFGRGGTSPEWYVKMEVVERIRNRFLATNATLMNPVHIYAVPLDYINGQLQAQGLPWRARVIDELYEFYIPA